MSYLNDFSKLRRNVGLHFKLGLTLSLAAALLAFNWTIYPDDSNRMHEIAYEADEVLEVVRTAHTNPTPPPPPPLQTERIELTESAPEYLPLELPVQPAPAFTEHADTSSNATATTPPPLPKPIEEPSNAPWIVVEEMPRFPGCEADKALRRYERQACAEQELLQYLAKHIRYPTAALRAGIEGTVVLRFIINTDGSIDSVELMRDIGGGCGQEALRVVSNMPKWTPGKQQGHPVRVMLSLPVRFQMSDR